MLKRKMLGLRVWHWLVIGVVIWKWNWVKYYFYKMFKGGKDANGNIVPKP